MQQRNRKMHANGSKWQQRQLLQHLHNERESATTGDLLSGNKSHYVATLCHSRYGTWKCPITNCTLHITVFTHCAHIWSMSMPCCIFSMVVYFSMFFWFVLFSLLCCYYLRVNKDEYITAARAGSAVVRTDPLRFAARCRTRRGY